MSRFSKELRIIPLVAWFVALVVAPCVFGLLLFLAMPHDPEFARWPLVAKIAFSMWPAILVGAAVLLIGYINADARRRGMRYVMWTLLAIFIPNSIGIILYFVLRDPLLPRCQKCGSLARPSFTYCAQCGAELSPTSCPSCKRATEPGWKSCPYCRCPLGQGGQKLA